MKKGNEREYEKIEDAEMMRIIHENARKPKKVKHIKKKHNVLKIAVFVSDIMVVYLLGVLTGRLWMR